VPLPLSVTGPIVSPGSLDEKPIFSPETPAPTASVTVAVAVLLDEPSATIDPGWTARVIALAGSDVCVRDAVAMRFGVTEVSLAVIVTDPTVVELVIVAV
jgi:hypothetical protein